MKAFICLQLVGILMTLRHVGAFNSGAPTGACAGVSPSPAPPPAGHDAQPQTGASPFNLTVNTAMPGYYVPGQEYTVTMDATETFRGFLVLARNNNSDIVGTFTARTGQQNQCTGPGGANGITHNVRLNANTVSFTWTAPAKGAGTVYFRFAGVVARINYWGNQTGPVLAEGAADNSGALHTGLSGTLAAFCLLLMSLFAVAM